jgi:EAL domain-containing protein (putative c-di-GMP-specific phosphodiesterase class I)
MVICLRHRWNADRRLASQKKLVSMVVRLCNELGAVVVAEGIETYDEYRAVGDSGAQYGQGYLFARPGFPMPSIAWPPPPLGSEPPTPRTDL